MPGAVKIGPLSAPSNSNMSSAGWVGAAATVSDRSPSAVRAWTEDDLPDFEPSAANVPEPELEPLVSSAWNFPEQCRALREAKAYSGE